ncbi:MAG: Uma2 family endonuclease [Bacteroidales bacterium]|nr:Uma2 family endonuclease [Bacteroidales bacterium]
MELQLDLNKQYTYADYLTWLDDKRRELINGFIKIMTPAPRRIHQEISSYLHRDIANYLRKKSCKVYHAPFDVRLIEKDKTADKEIINVVQPDISVICDLSKLDDRGCLGAPDFIIEILSPSTSKTDLKDKYALYQKFGVKEYWIVFPTEKVIYQYVLEKGKYEQKGIYVEDEPISPHIFPDLSIDLKEVFKD